MRPQCDQLGAVAVHNISQIASPGGSRSKGGIKVGAKAHIDINERNGVTRRTVGEGDSRGLEDGIRGGGKALPRVNCLS